MITLRHPHLCNYDFVADQSLLSYPLSCYGCCDAASLVHAIWYHEAGIPLFVHFILLLFLCILLLSFLCLLLFLPPSSNHPLCTQTSNLKTSSSARPPKTQIGLSCVIDEEKMHVLTEICGMPGYMAPEIFLRCACLFCLFSSSPCVHACVLLQVSCLYPGRRDFFSFLGF